MLLDDLLTSLADGLKQGPLTASEVCIGVFYTAVRLSNGYAGVAFTPRDMEDTVCCPRSAAQMPGAGRISGRNAWDLAREALAPNRLRRAVGVATLNALSALLMDEKGIPNGRLMNDTDALDAICIEAGDKVVMVGAFVPFIKNLRERHIQLRVIDKHPDALKDDERSLWVPPDLVTRVLPEADVAIITGSAMVEGGLDELLDMCRNAREIVLAGPTASLWPEPFFARGVTVMGGIKVRDAAGLMHVVAEGGSGYFFNGPADKMAIVRLKTSVENG